MTHGIARHSLREDGAATRSDEVYARLRRDIVRGHIRPNERLVEVELAERLDVSRTPVREGLQRLAADGLIVSRRRGWVVREHSATEIAQIYEVRMALEGMAARLSAERAPQKVLAAIAADHRAEAKGLSSASARQHLVEVNERFHAAIYESAGNRLLTAQILGSRDYYFNHRIAGQYSEQEAAASIRGHGRIVKALLARDGEAAERLTREHLAEALETTLAKLPAV